MNWQKEAIFDLKNYQPRKQSLENIKERIRALQEKSRSIKSAFSDATPVQGGGNRMEDALINNIVERQRLALTYSATCRLVRLTERGLNGLAERDRLILNKFYIERAPGNVEQLMEDLHIEKSQVYRIKDNALYNLTIGMYGIIDY